MKFRGNFNNLNFNFNNGKYQITFDIYDANKEECEKLKGKELWVEASEYERNRSLKQNRYMWELLKAIGDHKDINRSRQDVYEIMLERYEFPLAENVRLSAGLFNEAHIEFAHKHFFLTKQGRKYNYYSVFRGTSLMSSKELTVFINHIIDEAKELGIETLPPEELKRMLCIQ